MSRLHEIRASKKTARLIEKHLISKDRFKIICFPSLISTQDALRSLAYGSVPEGQVFIADRQSGGRGRDGRTFFSPESSGIYMSLMLRPLISAPSLSPKKVVHVTTAAAVAVCEAIEAVTGKKAEIKWVNDVICDGLKVSGILTEASLIGDAAGYDYVIVGIGVNLYKNGFPDELNGIAGALYGKKPLFLRSIKARLTAEILNRFDAYYTMISREDFSFVNQYRARSLVIGRTVDILIGGIVSESGEVISLNDDCSLNIKTENGETRTLSYGEVRIKLSEKE